MLKHILSEYESYIEDFIRKLDGNILVVDFDGTLCKLKYTRDNSERINYCKMSEIDKAGKIGLDFYSHTKPVKVLRYVIERVGKNNVYVLGHEDNTRRREAKKNWLRINDYRIKPENCYFTDTALDKQVALRWLQNEFLDKKIYYIDDDALNISTMEEMVPGIVCVHTSMLMP